MNKEYIKKLTTYIPSINNWIDELIENNIDKSVSVSNAGFKNINKLFSKEFLDRTKVVIVNGNLPFLPFEEIGLSEFANLNGDKSIGITYKNMYFINKRYNHESINFHELIHVLQWDRLGYSKFLLLYGVSFIKFGYNNNPLENMAYSLEKEFEENNITYNLVDYVSKETDSIWEKFDR